MSLYITCPQCKQDNPFGRMFCSKCGAKLEINTESMVDHTTFRERTKGLGARLVRLAVFLVLVGLVALMLWPTPPPGKRGDAQSTASVDMKIRQLRNATFSNLPLVLTLSEAEVNGYLGRMLEKTEDRTVQGVLQFVLKDVQVGLKSGLLEAYVATARSPIQVTYTVTGRVVMDSREGLQFQVTGARLGHLPMPPYLDELVAGKALRVFSGMSQEADLAKRLGAIDVESGQIRLQTAAAVTGGKGRL